MKTWQALLREHDPAGDTRLVPEHASTIRAAAVTAAARPQSQGVAWQRPLAIAAIILLMVGSGVVAGLRVAERDRLESIAAIDPGDEPAERRQLQFSTPGGTRIIWVFNSEFDSKETTP
jgi:hypothetical protein